MPTADKRQLSSGLRLLAALSATCVIVVAAYTGYRLLNEPVREVPSRAITVATADQPVGAALYVALAKGYFEDEGLSVTAQHHTSGRDAINSVIDGKADLCEVAETPMVFAVLRGIPVCTLATIASTDRNMAVIARRDKGVTGPADMVGKKIGVTTGTNGEFFLRVFLALRQIPTSSVEVVSLLPEEMLPTLVAGGVDAVATWNPHLIRLQKELGGNGITLPSGDVYTWAWNLAATQKFVAEDPDVVEKFVRAVVRAEKFIAEHSEESISIVAGFIDADPKLVSELWDAYYFKVSLGQWLLISMEDQARWAVENDLVETDEIPNYLDFFYLNALQAVDPSVVTIFH